MASNRGIKTKCDKKSSLLCFYINKTSRIQVVRISNIPSFFWEKVIFPGQRILFEAENEAKLEILQSENATCILADVIPCQRLRMTEC